METMKGLQNTDTDRTNHRLKSTHSPEEKNKPAKDKPAKDNGMTQPGDRGECSKTCRSRVSVILKDDGYLPNHSWQKNNGSKENHTPEVIPPILIGRRLRSRQASITPTSACSFRSINLLKL